MLVVKELRYFVKYRVMKTVYFMLSSHDGAREGREVVKIQEEAGLTAKGPGTRKRIKVHRMAAVYQMPIDNGRIDWHALTSTSRMIEWSRSIRRLDKEDRLWKRFIVCF